MDDFRSQYTTESKNREEFIERLISNNDVEGLIKLLNYKVHHYEAPASNIQLSNENVKLILNTLKEKKVDFFGILKRSFSTNNSIPHDVYIDYMIRGLDIDLLQYFVQLFDNSTFSSDELITFISDLREYYDKQMENIIIHKAIERESGIKKEKQEELEEKLYIIKDTIMNLEKRYIRVYKANDYDEKKYFEDIGGYLTTLEESICHLVNCRIKDEEIDELVDLSPVPVLLRVFSLFGKSNKTKKVIRRYGSCVTMAPDKKAIYTDTFSYFVKKIGDKVFATNNAEYIFKYLSNTEYSHIIPWEYFSEALDKVDNNFIEEIYKNINLLEQFVSKTGKDPKKLEFRNKMVTSILREQIIKEDVDYIKLFKFAINIGSLKYMYKYYCRIIELNKEIDDDIMAAFINKVVNTKNLQYIFLVFTQVYKNDLKNFYKYTYKLLNVIFSSNNYYLKNIILK